MKFSGSLNLITQQYKRRLLGNFSRYFHEGFNTVQDPVNDSLHDKLEENVFVRRGLPLTAKEYYDRKHLNPDAPSNPYTLKVAILGEPNVGKSTLTNRLIQWTVCAVSKKVHTTRRKSSLILVEDNKQVVFLDTPGFITPEASKRHQLEISLVVDPEACVKKADLIAVIVDAKNKWTNKRINEDILSLLNIHKDKKSILVVNKVDVQKNATEVLTIGKVLTRGALNGLLVDPHYKKNIFSKYQRAKKREQLSLEQLIEKTEKKLNPDTFKEEEESEEDILAKPLEHFEGAKGWPFFSRVFYVSALHDVGVDDLREYLLNITKPGEWSYHASNVTDSHPYDVALMIARQVLLDDLPQEIPYSVNLKIKSWQLDDMNCLRIHIVISCPKPHYKSLLIGKSGARIAKYVELTRQALQDTFRSEIFLRLGIE